MVLDATSDSCRVLSVAPALKRSVRSLGLHRYGPLLDDAPLMASAATSGRDNMTQTQQLLAAARDFDVAVAGLVGVLGGHNIADRHMAPQTAPVRRRKTDPMNSSTTAVVRDHWSSRRL